MLQSYFQNLKAFLDLGLPSIYIYNGGKEIQSYGLYNLTEFCIENVEIDRFVSFWRKELVEHYTMSNLHVFHKIIMTLIAGK